MGKGNEEIQMNDFINDPRFKGIEPFKSKVWLSSPTMHGEDEVVIIRLKLEQTA